MNSLKSSLGPLAIRFCTTLCSFFLSTAYDVRVTDELAEPASSTGLSKDIFGGHVLIKRETGAGWRLARSVSGS